MPKTLPGKLALLFLGVFVVQFVVFVVMVFSNNGFGAIVTFIQFAPFTSLLGFVFGVLGIRKESSGNRVVPIVSMLIGGLFLGFFIFFLFFWSFGG